MFEMIFSKIDQFYNNIPYKIRKFIAFLSLGIWLILAVLVSIFSFLKGKKDAPVVSSETQLNQFRETIIKNQNTKKRSIILPDLNDLVKQEIPLQIQNLENRTLPPIPDSNIKEINPENQKNIPLISQDEELIFPEKQIPYSELKEQYNFSREFQDIDRNREANQKNKNKLDIIRIEN